MMRDTAIWIRNAPALEQSRAGALVILPVIAPVKGPLASAGGAFPLRGKETVYNPFYLCYNTSRLVSTPSPSMGARGRHCRSLTANDRPGRLPTAHVRSAVPGWRPGAGRHCRPLAVNDRPGRPLVCLQPFSKQKMEVYPK